MESETAYRAFYERLGREYPEADTVHSNPFRLNFLLGELRPYAARGTRMLDIGCNNGVYDEPYCRMGGRVAGIDISPELVEKARARTRGLDAEFEVADVEAYRPNRTFPLVFMSEVLEHLRTPDEALRRVHDLTAPGGTLLLSTPSALLHVSVPRYLRELVGRRRLLERCTSELSGTMLGIDWGAGCRYRHDGYYLLSLADWIESFGFRCIEKFTIGEASVRHPFVKAFDAVGRTLNLRISPNYTLFGSTCVVKARRA